MLSQDPIWKVHENIDVIEHYNEEQSSSGHENVFNNVEEITVSTPNKLSLKSRFVNKIVERKLHKLTKKINKPSIITTYAQNNNTKVDLSWLWATLLIIAAIAVAFALATFYGAIAGLIAFLGILVLLYLVLPEEIGAALGQAAAILVINALLQLLLSAF
jgi:hypothetical protein